MTYLLDANTFIEAKNRYYSMAICPGYWQWILQSNQNAGVASIQFVKDELTNGNDDLAQWAKDHSHLFIPNDDELTQQYYIQVVQYVMKLQGMKLGAQDEFLRGADPWLIAKAIVTRATIVTHEKLDRNIKRKILIPNVCENFGVKYIDTFDLLHDLEAKFVISTTAA